MEALGIILANGIASDMMSGVRGGWRESRFSDSQSLLTVMQLLIPSFGTLDTRFGGSALCAKGTSTLGYRMLW